VAENRKFAVTNVTRGEPLASRSDRADNPLSRGLGLIPRKSLETGEGLIIDPCKSIVMFFMRFSLDVVFVDGEGEVCHLIEDIKPWRTSRIVPRSRYVVELPAGTIARTGTQLGDRIGITPV
jgi:uncharacterized membrane protein (UPF0127 family)